MEDRFFKFAILISVVLHLVLFVKLYVSPRIQQVPKKVTELSYQIETRKEEMRKQDLSADVKSREFVAAMPPVKAGTMASQDKDERNPLFNNPSEFSSQFKVFDRTPDKVKGMKLTKEVSVPVLHSEKISTPAYATYYQIVRMRIRDRAYANYTKLSSGDVYLTFIIKSNGSLEQLQIMENKSQANEFLRDVGVKSVQEASPFPPFPKDLNYPELTFNVQISFQLKEGE